MLLRAGCSFFLKIEKKAADIRSSYLLWFFAAKFQKFLVIINIGFYGFGRKVS